MPYKRGIAGQRLASRFSKSPREIILAKLLKQRLAAARCMAAFSSPRKWHACQCRLNRRAKSASEYGSGIYAHISWQGAPTLANENIKMRGFLDGGESYLWRNLAEKILMLSAVGYSGEE